MRYYGVSLNDIILKIQSENITLPGGSIEVGNYNYSVRIPGEIEKPEDMFNWIVKEEKTKPIYLKDLASIIYKYKEIKSISRIDGKDAVTLAVKKRTGENIITITDEVKKLLESEKKYLPENLKYVIMGDQSREIRNMVDDLENNIISSLILVVGVLLFAMSFRNSLFVGIAIPLSMLGMLVDNAIVLVDNCYRYMQLGKDRVTAAFLGSREIAMPIISSTLTTVAAFLPLMFWPGIMGDFMGYLPLTVMIVLAASLLVALTINPVICASFMKVSEKAKRSDRSKTKKYNFLFNFYRRILLFALKNRIVTLGGMVGLFILTIIIYGKYGKPMIFFPQTDPEMINIKINLPVGAKIDYTDKIVKKIENSLMDTPDMQHSVTKGGVVGREQTHKATIDIDMKKLLERSQNSKVTLEKTRDKLKAEPDVDIEVGEPEHGPPTGAPITVEISGQDYKILKRLLDAVKKEIEPIPGIVDLRDDFEEAKPEVKVIVDRDVASRMGLSVYTISNTIQAAIKGTSASKYRVGEDEYDITVRFNKELRANFNDLKEIIIFGKDDRMVPLSAIAKFEIKPGFGSINHKGLKRMITVEADNKKGYNAFLLRQEVVKRIEKLKKERGYYFNMAGEDEEQREAQKFLSKAFMWALFSIEIILIIQFNSIVLPQIIMFSVILSTMGALWGLLITGMSFSTIMTGIGIISLAGVVVNNAIVLLDFIEEMRRAGLSKFTAIVKSGVIRMRPVLLTTVTTLLGLIPMAIGVSFDFKKWEWITQSESSQMWTYMCVVVIFGLGVATVLTLVIVPVMYSLFTRKKFKAGLDKGAVIDALEKAEN